MYICMHVHKSVFNVALWLFIIIISADCLGLRAVTVHDPLVLLFIVEQTDSFTVCSTLLLPGLAFLNFLPTCQCESQSCICGPIVAVTLIYSIWWVSYGVTCRNRSHAAQPITGWLSSKSKSTLPSGQREVSFFNKLRNTHGTTTFQYQIRSVPANKNNTDLAPPPRKLMAKSIPSLGADSFIGMTWQNKSPLCCPSTFPPLLCLYIWPY